MNLNSGMAGYFILQAVNVDTGTVRHLADFENLILDAGLERMGTDDYLDVCRIGSGNSVPTVLQTALDNKIASTNSVQSNTHGAQGTAPYYGWKKKTFRLMQVWRQGTCQRLVWVGAIRQQTVSYTVEP